jgi:hypothetical protein
MDITKAHLRSFLQNSKTNRSSYFRLRTTVPILVKNIWILSRDPVPLIKEDIHTCVAAGTSYLNTEETRLVANAVHSTSAGTYTRTHCGPICVIIVTTKAKARRPTLACVWPSQAVREDGAREWFSCDRSLKGFSVLAALTRASQLPATLNSSCWYVGTE